MQKGLLAAWRGVGVRTVLRCMGDSFSLPDGGVKSIMLPVKRAAIL
jgi:hypothetical protein